MSMDIRSACLLGGSGFVGRSIADQLCSRGLRVRVLTRSRPRAMAMAVLPTAEIEWVQACGNYVNLHRRGHDYPLRSTLGAIEKRLDARFVRVHRSYLVNLGQVDAIEPTEAGDARVRMKDGAAVPCSRTHLDALRQRLR